MLLDKVAVQIVTNHLIGSDSVALGAVIIGRNEGDRLVACLASIPDSVSPVVYVDSGSTDGSVAAAKAAGAHLVALDMTVPFTAARARNAGFDALMAARQVSYVQFIDGDCVLQPGWLAEAVSFLENSPKVAVVCGRRRERFPEASVWNRLCDAEWDTPIGRAKACGGDALMRAAVVRQVGGFSAQLIAGEEPELCLRIRQASWEVWRLDVEMTLHDAAMTRIGQWWQRCRRAGHAFAEGAALHGSPPERHWVAETRRALAWGAGIPIATVLGTILSPWALLLPALYGLQILRLRRFGLERAIFMTLGKIPEAVGVLGFWVNQVLRRRTKLIEYK